MTPVGTRSRPILITGGSGQVGSELIQLLSSFAPLITPSRCDLDLSNQEAIRAFVREADPAVIINAGAYTAVDKAESDEASCFAINALAPKVLAEEAKRLDSTLIHFSTDYVFDGTKGEPYIEDDATHPLSVYGRSKLEGERAVLSVNPASIVLRCSWVYAARGSNFLLTMLRLREERDTLTIVDDQYGAPTCARDIAAGTSGIVRNALTFRSGPREFFDDRAGIYHMSAAGRTTWKGFAEAIFSVVPGKIPKVTGISSAQYAAPAPRPRNSVLSNEKIMSTFSIELANWETQLRNCVGHA